ncbi:MAG: 3-aminobutyryl-CoA aminotransferase [Planctomycetes bacterium ADurb.Bin412]|nr:MAG: 3-aminobutyryl-CoA aminotransferase [Planctomycetes bacterium ADurb.Bin412]
MDAAVLDAINKGTSCSLNCPEEVELADLLCELHPWAEKARFARTGGEAMAVAVRIARAHTGRDKIAFCGYHGWHDWYLAANLGTENALGEHLLPGLSPAGVPKCLAGTAFPFTYNRLDELEAIVAAQGRDLSAIVMEPIRNISPEPGFLEGVRGLACKAGAVLIVDEISAAFRMNSGGAHIVLGLEPDMAVFSKALGNGYPIAAVIGKGSIMDAAESTFISSTNWTERTGPAAALAVIDKFERLNVSEHLVSLGQRVKAGWQEIAARHRLAIKISGIDPMLHLHFCENHSQATAFYTQEMLKRGFLAGSLFYAMHAHTPKQLEKFLENTDAVWQKIAAGNYSLEGQPAESGFQRIN